MATKTKTRRWIPCQSYDLEAMESWLEEMARCGWRLEQVGCFGCTAAFAGLPGYPGALAVDTDGTLYISYPLSWALTAGVHLICLLVVRKKMNDQLKEESRLAT